MDIRLAVPDELDDQDRKAALDAALESVTRTAASQVRNGKVPPAAGEIKSGRVRWEPEPPGAEHFDLPGTVIGRGWGDCDDLAPWHAGSLRASGRDPGARAIVKKSGPKRWHAIVQRSDGSIEDPSAHAGMYSVSGAGLDPATVGAGAPIAHAMSADGRMCLALCPTKDPRHPLVFFARCDVPDSLEPWDWSSMSADHNPAHSIAKAIKTVRSVAGDDMEPEDDARLAAVHDLVLGHDPEEVHDALYDLMGEEVDVDGCMRDAVHSVGWFGSDLLKAVTSPITSAVKFIKHPSLSNLTHIATDPLNAALHAVPGHQLLKPLANLAHPFAKFIPGFGPLASAGLDAIAQGGIPSDPGQIAQMAMRNAGSMFGGGGGGGGSVDPMQMMQAMLAAFGGHGGGLGQVLRPWGGGGPAVMKF
jgi:hypothetical protein